MRIPILLFLATTVSAGLFADTGSSQGKKVVVPSWTKSKEGNALDQRPFGYDRVRLVQYLGRSMLSQIPALSTITKIAYRRDGLVLPTLTLKRTSSRKIVPIWKVAMGNFLGDAKNPSSLYPTTALKTVFNAKKVNYPNLPPVKPGPPPFLVVFPLDVPFVYRGAGLMIDHFAFEARAIQYSYFVDAERGNGDTGSFKIFGRSCPSGASRSSAVSSHPGGPPIKLLEFDGPVNSAAISVMGVSNTKIGPITLPFRLDAFGLKGCDVNVSFEILSAVITNSNGFAINSMPVPNDPKLAGIFFYHQWLNIDKRVNPNVQMSFSDGMRVDLGKKVGKTANVNAAIVSGVNRTGAVNGRVGFVESGITLVTEFTLR